MTPQLLTMDDTAKALAISRRTLERWVKSGACPLAPLKVGKRIRFSVRQVERFVSHMAVR